RVERNARRVCRHRRNDPVGITRTGPLGTADDAGLSPRRSESRAATDPALGSGADRDGDGGLTAMSAVPDSGPASTGPVERLLIESEPRSGRWNMAFDEALLEAAADRGET